MTFLGRHAIVIGASMGGLLAARALADHYAAVTLLERDALTDAPQPRKGVPQGRHAHGLLARGLETLELLFPGLGEEMAAQGAVYTDIAGKVLWFNHGVYLDNAPSAMLGLLISRPMLESGVRRRLLQIPSVSLVDECDVIEPGFDRSLGRVTGVRVRHRGNSGDAKTIGADLIVDASGRGSRAPAWLESFGYARPREESIKVDIGYMTRHYRRRPEDLGGKQAVVIAACRPDWRVGALLAQEGERWVVTLGGYLGDHPPADESGFVEFARSLQKPEIFDVIKDAEPLSAMTPYQFSANQRRRYEQLSEFPEGFLAFGDALCSFNPVYGQGMTVACMESIALRECLAAGPHGIARRFFRAASRLIDTPWQIAVGSDLQHPKVQGKRTAQVNFINWYIAKLYKAAESDPVLATIFLEVANLTRQPAELLAPAIALRVWRGSRSRAESAAESERPIQAQAAVGSISRETNEVGS